MRFETFELTNLDFLSVLEKFTINKDNLFKFIGSNYQRWETLCDYFAYNIIGYRRYELSNSLLGFIYSCYYTDTKNKENLVKIQEQEEKILKLENQLSEVETMVLYLSKQIEDLKKVPDKIPNFIDL
jgi:hypothetical protein